MKLREFVQRHCRNSDLIQISQCLNCHGNQVARGKIIPDDRPLLPAVFDPSGRQTFIASIPATPTFPVVAGQFSICRVGRPSCSQLPALPSAHFCTSSSFGGDILGYAHGVRVSNMVRCCLPVGALDTFFSGAFSDVWICANINPSVKALGVTKDTVVVERGDLARAKPEPDLFLEGQEPAVGAWGPSVWRVVAERSLSVTFCRAAGQTEYENQTANTNPPGRLHRRLATMKSWSIEHKAGGSHAAVDAGHL